MTFCDKFPKYLFSNQTLDTFEAPNNHCLGNLIFLEFLLHLGNLNYIIDLNVFLLCCLQLHHILVYFGHFPSIASHCIGPKSNFFPSQREAKGGKRKQCIKGVILLPLDKAIEIPPHPPTRPKKARQKSNKTNFVFSGFLSQLYEMKTTTNIYNGKGVLTKCDSFRINFDLGTLWRSSNLSFFVARNFCMFFYLFLPWFLVGQPTRFFVEFSFPLGWRSSSWSRPGHLFVNVTAPFLFSLCFSLAFELSFHFHTNWHSVFPQIATYLLVTVIELRLCSWGDMIITYLRII